MEVGEKVLGQVLKLENDPTIFIGGFFVCRNTKRK